MEKELTSSFNGVIQPAQKNDLPKLMAVERHSFPADKWPVSVMRAYLKESLQAHSKTFLLLAFATAADAKKPDAPAAGYVVGSLKEKKSTTGEILSVAVDPSWQGRKLGQQLLDKICESLRRAGAEKIVLEVRKENAVAIHLYEKNGFVKTRSLRKAFPRANKNIGLSGDGIEMTRFYGESPTLE